MNNIYQPPQSELIDESATDTRVRYGLLALITFVGFPVFQLVAWNVVPILNRVGTSLIPSWVVANPLTHILMFDTLFMSILYWSFCLVSVRVTNVNAWAFAVVFGIASGAVVLAENDWILFDPAGDFPMWYEFSSVFIGLAVSLMSVIYLKWKQTRK